MISSFAVVLTAYWLYALAVVPWIEPEPEGQTATTADDFFQEPVQERQALEALFGAGAWELDQPKVFESRQAKLLFKNYTKRSPNTVELRPCTLIFLPEDGLSVEERYQRAIVLEAPDGAVLEFDQPLDLTQGKMGRLVQGRLPGPVRIRSQGRSSDVEDDLLITTRDVTLTQQEITTSETVEFSWGPHFGRGKDLRIRLAPKGSDSNGLNLGGIQSIEVRQVGLVHLEVPESTHAFPGNSSPAKKRAKPVPPGPLAHQSLRPTSGEIPPLVATPGADSPGPRELGKDAPTASPLEPVSFPSVSFQEPPAAPPRDHPETPSPGIAEVTCRGPFRFETSSLTASFADQVEVRYMSPDGPTDSLRCDRLVVTFKAQSAPAASQKKASDSSKKATSSAESPSPLKENSSGKETETASPKETSKSSAKKGAGSARRLEPQRLEATGRPVVLEAPSRQSRAVAERMEYHLTTGRTVLEGGQEVWICHGPHEIHARKLEYTPGLAGKLGQGAAEGPGWLRAESDPRTGQTLQARWSQALQLRPQQGEQVLSLTGGAEVLYTGIGRLAAEQIHLWIKQQGVSGALPGKEVLTPDRVLAEEQVRLEHPQVSAAVNRLEVWFEMVDSAGFGPPAPPPSGSLPPKRPVIAAKPHSPPALRENLLLYTNRLPDGLGIFGHAETVCVNYLKPIVSDLAADSPEGSGVEFLSESPAPAPVRPAAWVSGAEEGTRSEDLIESRVGNVPEGAGEMGVFAPGASLPVAPQPLASHAPPPPPPAQHFEVQGRLLRVQVFLVGRQTEVGELILEGDVYLSETRTAQPGEKPLVVTGNQIHVVDASRPYLALSVQGQPAHVEARGLELNGPKINLHRGTNRLWIDGPGWMTLPVDRDLEGRANARNDRLDIHWQHRMEFDGRSIRFEDSVVAGSSCWQLRTDSLEVQLREPIVFTTPKAPPHPEVHRLICRSEVLLENRSVDTQGEVSRDRVEVADLSVDLLTGDLTASGPGVFRSVRRAQTEQPEGLPHRKSAPEGLRPGGSPTGLVFLSVEFQRSLVGNLKRREMTFVDRVRTIYGPVNTWEEELQWDQGPTLSPQVVLLCCDRLTVAELIIPPSPDRSLELLAVGNTVIESAAYMARAHRLSYAENKGLVVLEGDGRNDAELFSQPRIGAPRQRVAARKIHYWPATNHLSIDSASLLEVHQPEKKQ